MDKINTREAGVQSPDTSQTRGTDILIGCVVPAHNEAENLQKLLPVLNEQLAKLSPQYEILIVDDGSRDNTSEVAIELSARFPVRLLQLSRNFGKENALTAGIDHVRGDVVLLIDADLQHPVELIPTFYQHWRDGYDMVYGVRTDRDDEKYWKRRLSGWFYNLLRRMSDIPIEPNAGDFRLMDRRVVDTLKALPERNRFMKGLYGWVGFKSISVPFHVEHRQKGKSSFNFWRLMELAVTGITSFTSIPLRIWAGIGAIISIFSIIYGVFIAIRTIFFGVDLPGWATLTVGVTFLGGVQLFSIGVLGEYVARIFTEVKHRPPYVIYRQHDFDSPAKREDS